MLTDEQRAAFEAAKEDWVRRDPPETQLEAVFAAGIAYAQTQHAAMIAQARADERAALIKPPPLPTTADRAWAVPLAELVRAAVAVVDDTHKTHDERSSPHKYTAPFGAIAKLSAVLDKHFSESCAAIRARKDGQ